MAGGESAVRDTTINPLLSTTGANQSAKQLLQDVLCFAGTGTALFQPPMRCLASMDEAELDRFCRLLSLSAARHIRIEHGIAASWERFFNRGPAALRRR